MARHTTRSPQAGRHRKRPQARLPARQKLLEAAGQVFAEKGFSAATGKEICQRAKTNSAAVNYYFGGVEGLYMDVLREARDRLVKTEDVLAAVAGKTDAKARLEAVVGLVVRALTGPAASSWAIRVLGREIVAPSGMVGSHWDDVQTRVGIMKGIVGDLMELPKDHPAVARGCVSVMGPCLALLMFDRRTFCGIFPDFALAPKDAPMLTRHLVRFALAGLAAVAEDAKRAASSGLHSTTDERREGIYDSPDAILGE